MSSAFAPGRINLVGEHTDYAGGLALPAAIQLGITVHVRAASDRLELDRPSQLADAVWAELAELGRPPAGIVAEVESTLPIGVGLSSSAAFEVAVALALCAAADFELPPLELARACRRAELRAFGVPCGILDQAACVLGEEGCAVLLDCATLDHRSVPVPEEAVFVVVDSGVRRALADTAYAQRQVELAAGMEKRVRHVESENARVLEMAGALERGDLAHAGSVMTASHASLRDDYEVSIPKLDGIVEDALAAGAFGARLVGAGFGGSVLALTDAAHPLDGVVVRPSRGASSSSGS